MPSEKQEVFFWQGNQACAEGAIAAGCRFFAGYPITPASEIAEIMSTRLPKLGGTYLQMEDEIAAISAVIGAAWGGKMVQVLVRRLRLLKVISCRHAGVRTETMRVSYSHRILHRNPMSSPFVPLIFRRGLDIR
jgi:hypothetical protein